jgi:hemerythrin-like domain-containing protein
MSTASLRQDHDLIEKVVKSMETTVSLLQEGKTIPESILMPVIDFTKNFMDVCHHSKEENSLFPALEKTGMPTTMGPIAMMLMEHEMSRQYAKKIEYSAATYLKSGDATQLIVDMNEYSEHISQHLWKENNRLFMMAEARLQYVAEQVDKELNQIEETKLKDTGKTRTDFEKLAEDLSKNISEQTK